ncbi:hypothetical protein NE237_000010 [Protea cynaroides]|uniref:Uncharacterized protein n=1 Tax=Protea cynaroides TaxID=273540 RepID=A0A9Q0GKX4_9MAGN|nr:hypothetical protein NE237_000010 [Protea cynaroides]
MMGAEERLIEDNERRGSQEEQQQEMWRRSFFSLSSSSSCLFTLPLGESASTFDLEKAVCSHGLFMMAPNQWDPSTKTLQRPLRLSDGISSLLVRISHPPNSSSLHVLVFGADSLCPDDRQAVLAQVERMLRLSDKENSNVREFHKIHEAAKKGAFGRIFRSPTLFEDMVKCILLCNCHCSLIISGLGDLLVDHIRPRLGQANLFGEFLLALAVGIISMLVLYLAIGIVIVVPFIVILVVVERATIL